MIARHAISHAHVYHTYIRVQCNRAEFGRPSIAKANEDHSNILNSIKEDHWVMENVEFCILAASNGSHIVLSQHLLSSFMLCYIQLTDYASFIHSKDQNKARSQ